MTIDEILKSIEIENEKRIISDVKRLLDNGNKRLDNVPDKLGAKYTFGTTVYGRISFDEYDELGLDIDSGAIFFEDHNKNIYQLRIERDSRRYKLRLAQFVCDKF